MALAATLFAVSAAVGDDGAAVGGAEVSWRQRRSGITVSKNWARPHDSGDRSIAGVGCASVDRFQVSRNPDLNLRLRREV